MTTYIYTALDHTDKFSRGRIDARSVKQAQTTLEAQGLMVINVKPEKGRRFTKLDSALTRISRMDKIFFTSHLHTLLEAGIGMDQAIKITSEQTTNQKFQIILQDIHQRVASGQNLNVALTQYPQYFSEFFRNLVKVGESSGKLEEVLHHLLEQQERDLELITKARNAMIYPSVIITAMLIMVILMMTLVVPRITAYLAEYGVDLPFTTKVLIAVSNFLLNFWWLVFPGIVAIIILLARWVKTPKGRYWWDKVILKIPKVKTIVMEFNLARFSRAMSALLKSGISLDSSLDMAASVCGNVHYQNSARAGIAFVRKGIPVAEVLKGSPNLFPPLATRMIEVGEKTGKSDDMFTRLASFYERSVTNTLTNLSSIIEPVLLLLVGLGVAFIAISVLTPIWKFSETV